MKHTPKAILALLPALMLASCSFTAEKQAAQNATDRFHQRYNEAKFAEIHSTAAPGFQEGRTVSEFGKSMRNTRSRLGRFVSAPQPELAGCKEISKSISITDGWTSKSKTTVIATCQSQFERGSAVETLTFDVAGKQATLADYAIAPVKKR